MISKSLRRNVLRSATFETLDRRICLDATPQALPLIQSWSPITQIQNNDDWSGVPGIVGFRGDGLSSTPGTDPQTILGEGTPMVDVNANQTNPNTFATGGVTEFHIANPVVALSGSSTADAPYIQLHVNSTGVSSVRVSYRLRDIDGSADNATQAVALQYRIGSTGNFINVPAAFVPDATTGGSATQTTPVSVVLPAAAGNQSNLQLRIITNDAVGSDEWVGVDDISIVDATAPGTFEFLDSPYTVTENVGTTAVVVSRSNGSFGAASVRVRTVAGGTATAGADFTPVDQVLNFADGQLTASFNLTINNDTTQEPTETIVLELSEANGGPTISQATTTVSIIDNDATAPTGVVLNELLVNPVGTDTPFEYAEIRGGTSQSLAGVYFVSIEGDGADAGVADLVVSLNDSATGTNGLLMIKSTTGGFTAPSGTTVVGVPAFDTGGGAFENDSNSFALIFSTTPLAANTDLDTNNDGFLDLPAGASLLDAVGWLDGGATDLAYGPVLTQVTGTPQAATRFPNDLTPQSFSAWYNGNLLADNGSASVNYDPANASANLPPGAMITPGAPNFPTTGDTTPPTVTSREFVFDLPATTQRIVLDFSENVQASLQVSDFVLSRLFNGQTTVIAAGDIGLSYDTNGDIATLTFPNFTPNGSLPDGDYELFLGAGTVEDAAGNDLEESVTLNFFAFAGDANRDRTINIGDFSLLASNFNQPGTFTDGDFNYSGTVEIGDFSILASKFNQTLNPPARAAATSNVRVAATVSGTDRRLSLLPGDTRPSATLFSEALIDVVNIVA